jgi:hypothetical protein
LQKPLVGDNGVMAMGHADLHRVVKEMVKAEVVGRKDATTELRFCTSIASILMRDFEACISSRAIFILLELFENEATSNLVIK